MSRLCERGARGTLSNHYTAAGVAETLTARIEMLGVSKARRQGLRHARRRIMILESVPRAAFTQARAASRC